MPPSFRRLLACAIAALVLSGSGILPTPPARAATAAPSGLKSVSTSRNSVALSWKTASRVPKYRIQYSASASMSKSKYVRFVAPYAEITGLKASTTYYFRVRVKGTSSWSSKVSRVTSAVTR